MPFEISLDLQERLTKIAAQQSCSVEKLLADYADKTEVKHPPSQTQSSQILSQNQQILSAIFDGYMMGDMDGNILDANANYCDMLGYTRDELLQKTVFDLDAFLSTETITNNAQEISQNDISLLVETKQHHKNGHLIDLEINSFQVEPNRIECFIRDITSRKENERKIHRYEQEYRGIIESQIDLVSRCLPDTTLTFVNRAYCEYFDVDAETVIGQPYIQFAAPQSKLLIQHHMEEVFKDPSPHTLILNGKNARGEDKWVQWLYYGITDESGKVVEVQSVGRDVTDLMQAQQALLQQQELMSTILENIPLMLVQLDENRQYQYVNKHWMDKLGWTLEEVQSHPNIMEAFYPDIQYRQQVIETIHEAPHQWIDRKTCIRDGSILDTSWFNIRLSDGRLIGIGQDITQRIDLEQQRIYAEKLEVEIQKERELQELKDRFISIVSHEFRTPLSVIMTSVSLVTEYFDHLSREKIIDKLNNVQFQVKRMTHLMEDVLLFSKSEAGKTHFVPESIHVPSFCQKIINPLMLVDRDLHKIIYNVDDGNIHADPQILHHILTNLLSNALKYSPQTTTVTLTAKHTDHEWQFIISDNGIGIPQSDMSQIFEPFHRAINVHKLSGTGLGLSIVKDYVEIHNGTITVESTLAVGTTFTVTLPHQ